MITRIPIPGTTHQLALNAANMAQSAAVKLSGSSSYQSLAHAEIIARRAKDDLATLMVQIRTLKRQARDAEVSVAREKAMIAGRIAA